MRQQRTIQEMLAEAEREQREYTRWREIDKPVSPIDPIQPDGPRYVEGKLPAGFVLLLWDGNALRGPMQFRDQQQADEYLTSQPGVKQYLVVPKP